MCSKFFNLTKIKQSFNEIITVYPIFGHSSKIILKFYIIYYNWHQYFNITYRDFKIQLIHISNFTLIWTTQLLYTFEKLQKLYIKTEKIKHVKIRGELTDLLFKKLIL